MTATPSSPVKPSRDIEHNKRNLDVFGYAIHEHFLSPAQVTALRERLEEQAALEREQGVAESGDRGHEGTMDFRGAQEKQLPPLQLIRFTPNKGRVFIDLMMHPTAAVYLKHVFKGVPYNVATQAGTILRKGAHQMVVHADQQAWPFLTPVPVMLNIFVPLSDFDADMGATRLVPGSHLRTPPRIEPHPTTGGAYNPDPIEGIPAVATAGSAIMWESRTWHCSGASTSDKVRYSVATVYAMHFVKPQDFYPAMLHDDVYETLSEEERRMLGFEVHFEYAGRIGPRHPADTRCNTNCRHPYVPELRRGGSQRAVPVADMAIAKTKEHAQVVA